MAFLSKKQFNIFYNAGAAIVLVGAWMKLTHTELGPLTGNLMLTIGLLTEAAIFAISAFDTPEKEYEWEKVYPELVDGSAPRKAAPKAESTSELELGLSSKIDKMLADAKIDASMFQSFNQNINRFGDAVGQINQTADAAASTQKYSSQMAEAAGHVESLNALYQLQLENGKKQLELNKNLVEELAKSSQDAEAFKNQMATLNGHLENLNKVYGGMLTAMKH
ncbi:MAG: gliding motility protein GldL [Flavobacteriaceae bacterium]|nr:MAG: gliding motility protein GldL [Flavobacteriaceae bacterium]